MAEANRSKPKGKERAALLALVKKLDRIQAVEDDLGMSRLIFDDDDRGDSHGNTERLYFTATHGLEGIRQNGTNQATTIVTTMLLLKRIKKALPARKAAIVDAVRRADRLIKEIEEVCRGFRLCRTCKGSQGLMVKVKPHHGHIQSNRRWVDCEACEGRGAHSWC